MIPYGQVESIKRLLKNPVVVSGEDGFFISRNEMLELLAELGCEWKADQGKMNVEDVQKMNPGKNEVIGVGNEGFSVHLPQQLLDHARSSDQNFIRCIFDYQNVSLKEVARKYGGRSAAANLSNLMAKPNHELVSMRSSTMERLAAALECPLEWISLIKHPEQMSKILNDEFE